RRLQQPAAIGAERDFADPGRKGPAHHPATARRGSLPGHDAGRHHPGPSFHRAARPGRRPGLAPVGREGSAVRRTGQPRRLNRATMSHPTPCYHCGLPVPSGSRFVAPVLGERREFCCPGCQAVAEAIVQGGLESYYRHRSEPSANPETFPQELNDELALYDRPEVQQPFVQHQGDLAETCLLVEGISCAACGWLIEKHLRSLPGVAEARLNLSNHRLQVRWADSEIPLSELLKSLRRVGYAAHPYQADKAAEQLASENRRALRQIGMAGLLWFQVMMATMATWPEFNLDLSHSFHVILRW